MHYQGTRIPLEIVKKARHRLASEASGLSSSDQRRHRAQVIREAAAEGGISEGHMRGLVYSRRVETPGVEAPPRPHGVCPSRSGERKTRLAYYDNEMWNWHTQGKSHSTIRALLAELGCQTSKAAISLRLKAMREVQGRGKT